MRIIKFRGKTVPDGRWVYGYYVVMENEIKTVTHHAIMDLLDKESQYIKDGKSYHMSVSVVEAETVGQFTGLHDKNGKEIYEGDIVLWERKKVHIEGHPLQDFSDVCKIYYDDKLHTFRYWYKLTCGSVSSLLTFNDDRAEASYIEVIGNIHDNPELLKG